MSKKGTSEKCLISKLQLNLGKVNAARGETRGIRETSRLTCCRMLCVLNVMQRAHTCQLAVLTSPTKLIHQLRPGHYHGEWPTFTLARFLRTAMSRTTKHTIGQRNVLRNILYALGSLFLVLALDEMQSVSCFSLCTHTRTHIRTKERHKRRAAALK